MIRTFLAAVVLALASWAPAATWAQPAKTPVSQDWNVWCEQDKVTLEWTCIARKWTINAGKLSMLRVDHAPKIGFCFMGPLNNHPGRTAIIRIGANPPISYEGAIVCGDTAKTIISQLLAETDGAARGTRWPSRADEFEFHSAGFPDAWEILQAYIANPRPTIAVASSARDPEPSSAVP